MTEKKSYPEEMYERRLARYRQKKRTKQPWQEVAETALRVNGLMHRNALRLKFPDDFLMEREDAPGGRQVPANLFDLKFEYDPVIGAARVSGSGGSVLLDQSTCMIAVARYFVGFIQPDSCGQCTFCRVGVQRMFEALDRICRGQGLESDISNLQALAEKMKVTSLCQVGQTAAEPVLATLRHFRKEYEERVTGQGCQVGKCNQFLADKVSRAGDGL